MKKERISFDGIRILVIISLIILISSCNGQENRNDTPNKILQSQTVSQKSTLDNKQSKKQISQVVRMMFEDSKGNIWFGTQNGAFRLTNNSLTHIDNIKSELGKRVTCLLYTSDAADE